MRLRKFNESIEKTTETIDFEYVNECFIDTENCEFNLTTKKDKLFVNIELPDDYVNSNGSVENISATLEYKLNLNEDIKVALMKVGTNYPDYQYYIEYEEFYVNVTIYAYESSFNHKLSSIK